jgi:hypothetical protein
MKPLASALACVMLLTGCITVNVQAPPQNSPENPPESPSSTVTESPQEQGTCPLNELSDFNEKLSGLLKKNSEALNPEKNIELWVRKRRDGGSFRRIDGKEVGENAVALSFVSRNFPNNPVTEAVVLVSYVEKGGELCFRVPVPQNSKDIDTMRKFMSLIPGGHKGPAY